MSHLFQKTMPAVCLTMYRIWIGTPWKGFRYTWACCSWITVILAYVESEGTVFILRLMHTSMRWPEKYSKEKWHRCPTWIFPVKGSLLILLCALCVLCGEILTVHKYTLDRSVKIFINNFRGMFLGTLFSFIFIYFGPISITIDVSLPNILLIVLLTPCTLHLTHSSYQW